MGKKNETVSPPKECHLDWCAPPVPADGCTSPLGAWHCYTCHKPLENNLMAQSHRSEHPEHQMVWSCGEHMRLEIVEFG